MYNDRRSCRFMYQTEEEHPALELEAIMLNVNRDHNPELMEACKTLRDYAEYTDRVRRYKDAYETLEEAVGRAIDECIEEGVLADFLRRHRAEVISVSIYEFIDDEKFLKMQREDAYEEGRADGRIEGRAEGRADGISVGKLEMLYELVRKDLISLKDAAQEANQTEEEFEAGMKAYFEERESA